MKILFLEPPPTLDWEPGSLTYYYDGQPVWTYTDGVPSARLYLHAVYGVGQNVYVPAQMSIDYIRVWQHPFSSAAR